MEHVCQYLYRYIATTYVFCFRFRCGIFCRIREISSRVPDSAGPTRRARVPAEKPDARRCRPGHRGRPPRTARRPGERAVPGSESRRVGPSAVGWGADRRTVPRDARCRLGRSGGGARTGTPASWRVTTGWRAGGEGAGRLRSPRLDPESMGSVERRLSMGGATPALTAAAWSGGAAGAARNHPACVGWNQRMLFAADRRPVLGAGAAGAKNPASRSPITG